VEYLNTKSNQSQ